MTEEEKKALEAREAAIEKKLKALEAKELKAAEEKKTFISGGGSAPLAGNRQSSYENNVLRSFGCNTIKSLLDVNVADRKFGGIDYGLKQAVLSVKEAFDIGRFVAQMFYDQPVDKGDRDKNSNVMGILETPYGKDVLVPMLRAFGTGADGAEWIPTALSSQFIEEFELEKQVANSFKEMQMPTNPFKIPILLNQTVARIAGEGVALTGKSFSTADLTFDATKLGEFYPLPEELNEDSAPQILAVARQEVAEAQIRARETMILNGDTAGVHMDSDVVAADDARKAAKGIREIALANSANGSVIDFGGPITDAKLGEMRKAMGAQGINVRKLLLILGSTGFNQAQAMPEVSTVDQFGPMATIHNGSLSAWRGVPILASAYVREDLNEAGVHDGLTEDNTVAHLVNLDRFWLGMRRAIKVRVMPDLADQDRWLLSSYSRIDFQGFPQSDKEVSSVVGVNVSI